MASLSTHVLDTMHAIYAAAESGRRIPLESSCERPAALPAVWPEA